MSLTTAPVIDDDPLTIAWENTAFYLHWAAGLFGDPAQMAKRVWISAADHKAFCAYMRPLEMMVRRIIFIMALKLAPMTLPEPPERKFRERVDMPISSGAHFDPAKPETWRVSSNVSARSAGAPAGMFGRVRDDAGGGAGAPSPPPPARNASKPSSAPLSPATNTPPRSRAKSPATAPPPAPSSPAPTAPSFSTNPSGALCSTSSR